MRSSRIVVMAVGLMVVAGGCSGSDDGPKPEPSASSSPAETPTSASTGIISPQLPDIPEFRGKPKGVIKDVTVTSCDTEQGTVKATGTATNSDKDRQDIVVVISWAATTTSDVVARGVTKLEGVGADEKVDWTVEAELKSDVAVACVPTALRGTLK